MQDLVEEGIGVAGRITVYAVAEAINRKLLEARLRDRGPDFLLSLYPDALYGQYEYRTVRV
jgi:hypothetical protein